MIENRQYSMAIQVLADFSTTKDRAREALAAQGFGVLTEIDVTATLKNKLQVDVRPYVILGACNPQLAHRAMKEEADLGVLLPCNIAIYADDGGSCTVCAVDPVVQFSKVGNPILESVAVEVRSRLRSVLENLERDLGVAAPHA